MNNKGFTLVELIATIALLAIIAVISFVSINAVTEQSKVSNCESLVMNITSAAKEYVSDNRYNFNNNNARTITVEDLIAGNYLSSPIVDPFNNKEMDSTKISVSIQLNNDYTAKNITVKVDGLQIDCTNENVFQNIIIG